MLSLTTSQLPAYLFISSKNWRHGKVAHVLLKKSVKLLWKDDPCNVKKQFLTSEELDILLSKNCSIKPCIGGSLGCAPGCDAGGREFETPTRPTLRVFK